MLPGHLWLAQPQLQQGHGGVRAGVARVQLQALLQLPQRHIERPLLHVTCAQRHAQFGQALVLALLALRIAGNTAAGVHVDRQLAAGRIPHRRIARGGATDQDQGGDHDSKLPVHRTQTTTGTCVLRRWRGSTLPASWPQAPSIPSPRVLRTVATRP